MTTLRGLTMNTLAPAYVAYPARRDVLRAELRRLAPDVPRCTEVEPDQVADLLGEGHHVVRHRSVDPDDPVGAALASRWPFGDVQHVDLPGTNLLPWAGAVIAEVPAPKPRTCVTQLPASGHGWNRDRTGGTLVPMPALTLRLVARRHVDLRRVSSALCRR